MVSITSRLGDILALFWSRLEIIFFCFYKFDPVCDENDLSRLKLINKLDLIWENIMTFRVSENLKLSNSIKTIVINRIKEITDMGATSFSWTSSLQIQFSRQHFPKKSVGLPIIILPNNLAKFLEKMH